MLSVAVVLNVSEKVGADDVGTNRARAEVVLTVSGTVTVVGTDVAAEQEVVGVVSWRFCGCCGDCSFVCLSWF